VVIVSEQDESDIRPSGNGRSLSIERTPPRGVLRENFGAQETGSRLDATQ
jgi:hypothetical protein